MAPKYPYVHVKLVGEDGNAFAILGRVTRAMRREGLSQKQIDEYHEEATNGDYNHLLCTTIQYVDCDGEGVDGDDEE